MATKSETNFIGPKKSRGAQAITIATQDRTSNVSVSAVHPDLTPSRGYTVQLLCGSTITRSVRDEELATWEGSAREGSERKQPGE